MMNDESHAGFHSSLCAHHLVKEMEVEKSFSVEDVEARGALCVECMASVASGGEVFDRVGAVLCRACAAEFYAACGVCGGLVARDEALARAGGEALFCFECLWT